MLIKTPCFELKTIRWCNKSIYTYIIEISKVTLNHRDHIIRCIIKHLEKTNPQRARKIKSVKAILCIFPVRFNTEQPLIQNPFIYFSHDTYVFNNPAKNLIYLVHKKINCDLVINKLDMFYVTNKMNQIGFGIGSTPIGRNFGEFKIESAYVVREMDLD